MSGEHFSEVAFGSERVATDAMVSGRGIVGCTPGESRRGGWPKKHHWYTNQSMTTEDGPSDPASSTMLAAPSDYSPSSTIIRSETVYEGGESAGYAVTENGTAFMFSLDDGTIQWQYDLSGIGYHTYAGGVIAGDLFIWPSYWSTDVDGVTTNGLTRLGAVDRETGDLVWIDTERENYAYTDTYCAPTLYNDMVLIWYEGAVQAFDHQSGNLLWTTMYDGSNFGYGDYYHFGSTPAISEDLGIAVMSNYDATLGIDLENDGEVLWTGPVGGDTNAVVMNGVAFIVGDGVHKTLDAETGEVLGTTTLSDVGLEHYLDQGAMGIDGTFYTVELITADDFQNVEGVLVETDPQTAEITINTNITQQIDLSQDHDIASATYGSISSNGSLIYLNASNGRETFGDWAAGIAIDPGAGEVTGVHEYYSGGTYLDGHGAVPWQGSLIVANEAGEIWRVDP